MITKEQIIAATKAAGMTFHQGEPHPVVMQQLESFAQAIYALAMEDAAKTCDTVAEDADSEKRKPLLTQAGKLLYEGMWGGGSNCAEAIRNRSKA